MVFNVGFANHASSNPGQKEYKGTKIVRTKTVDSVEDAL